MPACRADPSPAGSAVVRRTFQTYDSASTPVNPEIGPVAGLSSAPTLPRRQSRPGDAAAAPEGRSRPNSRRSLSDEATRWIPTRWSLHLRRLSSTTASRPAGPRKVLAPRSGRVNRHACGYAGAKPVVPSPDADRRQHDADRAPADLEHDTRLAPPSRGAASMSVTLLAIDPARRPAESSATPRSPMSRAPRRPRASPGRSDSVAEARSSTSGSVVGGNLATREPRLERLGRPRRPPAAEWKSATIRFARSTLACFGCSAPVGDRRSQRVDLAGSRDRSAAGSIATSGRR